MANSEMISEDRSVDAESVALELTNRQKSILKALVQEYVGSVSPVGSKTIRRRGTVGFSAATIRNELGVLEEMGYLSQPHTSAGRVPTVQGYRYFVEQLMEEVELPLPEQRTIRHQFHQIRLNLDQWMSLTAAVLAHTSRSASLVTPPHSTVSRFRHLELISINEGACLLILVLQDSSIHQEILSVTNPISQDQLSTLSNKMNALLRNRSAYDVHESTNPELTTMRGWEERILQRVLVIMERSEERSVTEIYRDGLVNVFSEPEFEDPIRLRQLLEILEKSSLLERILARILKANGVQIIIGGEGPYEEIDDVSFVLSPYGLRGKASGVLGVMGPTRMSYARAISTVRYVARIMDGLISEVYGVPGISSAEHTEPIIE
jgi:heat-inducible transcriptional repressor